jgi:homoserine dehydrogenase
MTKITLNADKRKMIADIFQNHFEQQPSKAKIDFESAKQNFDSMVDNVHQLANTVVRHHQPQEDLDTIKAMELNMVIRVVFGIKTHVLTLLILLLKLIKEGKNVLTKMKLMLVLN